MLGSVVNSSTGTPSFFAALSSSTRRACAPNSRRSNFYDYVVSRNSDLPPMHVEVIQTDNPPTGVGQMAKPLITPAVSNALMALTGVRLRHAPFTEERVKKALG
jgi:CO/xanthine dehydrogenase Mo-binding subunit